MYYYTPPPILISYITCRMQSGQQCGSRSSAGFSEDDPDQQKRTMKTGMVRVDWILFVLILYIQVNNFSVTCLEDFFPGTNQYQAVDKVYCTSAQYGDSFDSQSNAAAREYSQSMMCYNANKILLDQIRVRLAPLNWFKPSSKIFY